MRELIVAVAGHRQWSDNRKSWLDRAARKAGISYRQVKAIWYGEITDSNHRSARLLRDAAELAMKYEEIVNAKSGVGGTELPDQHMPDLVKLASELRSLASHPKNSETR